MKKIKYNNYEIALDLVTSDEEILENKIFDIIKEINRDDFNIALQNKINEYLILDDPADGQFYLNTSAETFIKDLIEKLVDNKSSLEEFLNTCTYQFNTFNEISIEQRQEIIDIFNNSINYDNISYVDNLLQNIEEDYTTCF